MTLQRVCRSLYVKLPSYADPGISVIRAKNYGSTKFTYVFHPFVSEVKALVQWLVKSKDRMLGSKMALKDKLL